jgi:hypothetical protein
MTSGIAALKVTNVILRYERRVQTNYLAWPDLTSPEEQRLNRILNLQFQP